MVKHGNTECSRITGTSVQNLLLSRFSNNLKFLTHSVVTLVGYIRTRRVDTLAPWAPELSTCLINLTLVIAAGHRRHHCRRQRRRHLRRQRHCGRRLQRNKTKQATGSTRCDCAPWGPFFNYVDHFFYYWPSTYPKFTLVKEYLHCYCHYQYHILT